MEVAYGTIILREPILQKKNSDSFSNESYHYPVYYIWAV